MEFTELKREIDRAISSVKNKAYEDALDYLNDVGTNLQFDIDDWLVESEEDEKSIRCYQETLEALEEAQFILDSLLDEDEEDLDNEENDEEYEDEDKDSDRIIQILSSIEDKWME